MDREKAVEKIEKSEARRYLENIEWMRKEIERLEVQNAEYNDRKINIRGIDYAKERVQTSPDGDPMKMVDWYNDEIKKNNLTIYEFDRECKKAKEYIDQLSDQRYSDLLYYHYIRTYGLQQVADMMRMSYPWVRSLKGEALVAFQDEVIEPLKARGETISIYKPTS